MPVNTKRWNDRRKKDDGFRLLVCRYRPRALSKKDETWDTWCQDLGPSKELHAAFYGKTGESIDWEEYKRRYLEEMQNPELQGLLEELAQMLREGKTITLLCSSACGNEAHCHRTLLRELIETRAGAAGVS